MSTIATATTPIWLQILTHLVQQERQACDQLDLIVRLYHDPLADRGAGLLTFAQHWSLFSNLATLTVSQRTLFTRFSEVVDGISFRYQMLLDRGGEQPAPSIHVDPTLPANPNMATLPAAVHQQSSSMGLPPLARRGTSSFSSPELGDSLSCVDVAPLHLAAGPPQVIDPLELLAGVAENTFGHSSMSHFMAEHMMYTLNYGRSIFPMLNEMIEAVNSTAAGGGHQSGGASPLLPVTQHQKDVARGYAKLMAVLRETSAAASAHGLHKLYIPEVDPLASRGPMWGESAAAEELLMYLATPLPSLQRYCLAARCLIEAHCFSGAAETLLMQFAKAAALRSAEEGSMLLDQCSCQEVAALVGRMDGFTMPPADSRMLLHYGRLTKKFQRGRHSRLMFVFSDVLCYVEEQSSGRMRVRGLLPVMAGRPLAVRDVEDEVEKDIVNCFEIVCDGKLYVFFAESQVQKAHWTAAIAYAIAAAERRLHPQMVAKATSGDIIMTVRSTWGTTQPKSRLGRQRREDAKMQLQQSLARQPSGLSRVSSSASSTAAAGTRPPQPPALAGIATPQRDETPTDRENRRKAMARHSLRGSFDVSHWTQIPAASHQRVRSQDLLGSFASHSGAESLALSFGLAASSPAAAADEQQQQGHTMAVHTMPPAVSPALRVPLHGSPSKADIGLPPDEPAEEESGADCTSLLT